MAFGVRHVICLERTSDQLGITLKDLVEHLVATHYCSRTTSVAYLRRWIAQKLVASDRLDDDELVELLHDSTAIIDFTHS